MCKERKPTFDKCCNILFRNINKFDFIFYKEFFLQQIEHFIISVEQRVRNVGHKNRAQVKARLVYKNMNSYDCALSKKDQTYRDRSR